LIFQVVSTNVASTNTIKMSPPLLPNCPGLQYEVHQMTVDYPERFAGLATLPMQDIKGPPLPNWNGP